MTLKKTLIVLAVVLFIGKVFSQNIQSDSISKAEISKLEFLVGNWKGTGWMMDRDGEKQRFDQTEKIQFKLDSTAILIEGQGKSNGRIIHNAMAIISYNKDDAKYTFHSYLQNGSDGKFKAELKGYKFYWYPNEITRFIIWINEQSQWYEKGEFNQGGTWVQFFEMTLDKQ